MKWVKGINVANLDEVLISKTNIRTRNNGYKFDKFRCRKEINKSWFTDAVADECSNVNRHEVDANTIESF